jgi:hypothetical protein
MIDKEMVITWKGATVVKVLSQYLSGGTEENQETLEGLSPRSGERA